LIVAACDLVVTWSEQSVTSWPWLIVAFILDGMRFVIPVPYPCCIAVLGKGEVVTVKDILEGGSVWQQNIIEVRAAPCHLPACHDVT
jgi:hypothetical protein